MYLFNCNERIQNISILLKRIEARMRVILTGTQAYWLLLWRS